MEESRWGAVCPGTFWAFAHSSRQVLTFRVFRAFDEARLLVTAQNALPKMSNSPFYLFGH